MVVVVYWKAYTYTIHIFELCGLKAHKHNVNSATACCLSASLYAYSHITARAPVTLSSWWFMCCAPTHPTYKRTIKCHIFNCTLSAAVNQNPLFARHHRVQHRAQISNLAHTHASQFMSSAIKSDRMDETDNRICILYKHCA